MPSFSTLRDVLEAGTTTQSRIVFIESADQRTELSFERLHRQALSLLGRFQALGLSPGDEIIIHVNDNPQFLHAFWACMLGGMVPVPVGLGISDEHKLKLWRIFRILRDPHLYTDEKTLARLEAFAGAGGDLDFAHLHSRTILTLPLDGAKHDARVHATRPEDLAFIQFSSGSTSEPKGVMLTHANVLANMEAIAVGVGAKPGDRALSWMPLTHDMGLIGFHLTPLAAGISHWLMPTDLFVRRPMLWMQMASDERISVTCSPNFGYRHFLKALRKHPPEGLDLSGLRLIFNGAEPISVTLCQEFLGELRPYGLQDSTMFPVYGLAEASLAATFPEAGSGMTVVPVVRGDLGVDRRVEVMPQAGPDTLSLVCLGHPVRHCEVRIAGDGGGELPAQTIGHVLIRGDNVTQGYFMNEEATRNAISGDGWLDTGDLGFMTGCGLVITGRAKEIIFANGQNYYPHDLEAILEREVGLELGKVAVAAHHPVGADSDELLVFVVHKGPMEEFVPVARDIHAKLNAHTGLEITHILPVIRIPKTTSGKVQRYLMIQAYRAGEYDELLKALELLSMEPEAGVHQDLTGIERQLKALCDQVMPERRVGPRDNLFDIGTSSLELAQLHEGVEKAFPGLVDVTDLFDYPTIAELATLLEEKLEKGDGE